VRQIKYAGSQGKTIPSPIRESLEFSVTDPHTIALNARRKMHDRVGIGHGKIPKDSLIGLGIVLPWDTGVLDLAHAPRQ